MYLKKALHKYNKDAHVQIVNIISLLMLCDGYYTGLKQRWIS